MMCPARRNEETGRLRFEPCDVWFSDSVARVRVFQTGRRYVYRGRSEARSQRMRHIRHAHAAEHPHIVEHDKYVLHSRERARLPRPYAHEATRANGNGHSSRSATRSGDRAREMRAGINKHPD